MFLATGYEEKEELASTLYFAKHCIVHVLEPLQILFLDCIYRPQVIT